MCVYVSLFISLFSECLKNDFAAAAALADDDGKMCEKVAAEKKKPHIKKPLNAFMLYMKEMRAKVVAECTLKEKAAINQNG